MRMATEQLYKNLKEKKIGESYSFLEQQISAPGVRTLEEVAQLKAYIKQRNSSIWCWTILGTIAGIFAGIQGGIGLIFAIIILFGLGCRIRLYGKDVFLFSLLEDFERDYINEKSSDVKNTKIS